MKTRVIALLLTIVCLLGILPVSASAASAAWPSVSSSRYCEFIAQDDIAVYKNTGLTQRGTYSPAKSYNAYISQGDSCRILEFNKNYLKVSYPTSSGYRTGYIGRSEVFASSAPNTVITAAMKVTTYKYPGTQSSYGSIAAGDTVYNCGTSGNYTLVIYDAKSGSRAFKMGYIKTSDYQKISKTNNEPVIAASAWSYPMNDTYVCGNDWSEYYAAKGGDHLGIDIASGASSSAVKAAANGTVAKKGYNSANGYFVILEHSLSGKTVYSFYAHLAKASTVREGAAVNAGETIGYIGNSGSSSKGTHLHFAITDTLKTGGGYWGYTSKFSGDLKVYSGVTYYNPHYVVKNDRLPS